MDVLLTSGLSVFTLIFLAEVGDKSQLVCMLLASRHRGVPVFLGAVVAFALLNILAVTVGAALTQVIPAEALAVAVAVLFSVFGIKALLEREDGDENIEELPGHTVFITSFLMIFVAELGDKTQLSVAALGASMEPVVVYLGATVALVVTTLIGVAGGRWLTQKVRVITLHRVSGVLFLLFAGWVLYGLLG